jgi:DNA invertase Pin-like site-specific DNA recombinase
MKRAALYMRVSTLDQHPETQLYDLRQMAQQRGYQIVEEYTDRISGAKARRPGLDALMRDARRGVSTLSWSGLQIVLPGRSSTSSMCWMS